MNFEKLYDSLQWAMFEMDMAREMNSLNYRIAVECCERYEAGERSDELYEDMASIYAKRVERSA